MSFSTYIELRRDATNIADFGEYNRYAAQMNPLIFEEFLFTLADRDVERAIWEPFAGGGNDDLFCDWARENGGFELVGHTLGDTEYASDSPPHCRDRPTHLRKADSTKEGPGCEVGGVMFHPPYFGSANMSGHEADLGAEDDYDAYVKRLQKTVDLVTMSLVPEGLVCAVGRDYRHRGQRIRLDKLYVETFGSRGLELEMVWSSEPDVALIFRRPI